MCFYQIGNAQLYTDITQVVHDNIYSNGDQIITGDILQGVLDQVIQEVGASQVFACPATSYNPPTQNPAAYLVLPGTYTNFYDQSGPIHVSTALALLKWDGTYWHQTPIPVVIPIGIANDSVFTTGNSICVVQPTGDTICVSNDSIYIQGSQICTIQMGDTTCTSGGSSGVNIYNANGILTTDRWLETAGHRLTFQRLGVDVYQLGDTGDTASTTIAMNYGTQVYNVLRLRNLGTGNIPVWFDGQGANQDFCFGVNKSDNSFVMSEGVNLTSVPYLKYYGVGDSIVLYKDLKLRSGLRDKDGDLGTAGQVLTSFAGGLTNWATNPSADGNGFFSSANQAATMAVTRAKFPTTKWTLLESTGGSKLDSVQYDVANGLIRNIFSNTGTKYQISIENSDNTNRAGLLLSSGSSPLSFFLSVKPTTGQFTINKGVSSSFTTPFTIEDGAADSTMTMRGSGVMVNRRIQGGMGASVASAGDLTLGLDGNVFHVTGTTTINAITTTNWRAGAIITLIFDASLTLKQNTAGGANTAVMKLASATDANATATDVYTFVFDSTQWIEVSRSVN